MVPGFLPMIAEFLPHLREAAPIILALIVIEGLLSVDNILAIAALASQLPEKQQKIAVRLGQLGAYLYRGLALVFVSFILANEWVTILGALYLVHLMAEHFSNWAFESGEDRAAPHHKLRTFWATVAAILLMDLILSVDIVITAVAMSSKLWIVCTGVGLGLLTLWMFATVSLTLVRRFPVLKHVAFQLIGYVGCSLLVEIGCELWLHRHVHITALQKFYGIALIIGLSLFYSGNPRLQHLCRPAIHAVIKPIEYYDRFATALIAVLLRPFKALAGALRKRGILPKQKPAGPRPFP